MERVLSHCYALRPPGRLAQLGERRLDKAEVTGSSPVSPIKRPAFAGLLWLYQARGSRSRGAGSPPAAGGQQAPDPTEPPRSGRLKPALRRRSPAGSFLRSDPPPHPRERERKATNSTH